jgi:formyltetrahydrofolate synthetase
MSYNFEQTLGDYKRREKQAMEKLENVTKAVKGGKGNMQASVAATEEIRTWEEHLWDRNRLCNAFKTDKT